MSGEPSMGTFETYKGPSGAIVGESPWFTYADIVGPEMIVVIEQVRARKGVRFHEGKARSVEMFLKFRGLEKELRVGATIRRSLDKLFGTDTTAWFGKAVVLFVQDGIRVGGETRLGVRIRDRKVDPSQAAPVKAAPPVPAAVAPAPTAAPSREPGDDAPMDAAPASSAPPAPARAGLLRDLSEESVRGDVSRAAKSIGIALKTLGDLRTLTDDDLARIHAETFQHPLT